MQTTTRYTSYWDSFKYWFGRRSLRSRLLMTYLFIIVVPSTLLCFYLYEAINNMHIRDAREQNEWLLEMEELHINTQVESMVRAVQVAYDDIDVREYLANTSELDSEKMLNFSNYSYRNLTRIQYYNPNVAHLRLFSSSDILEIWPIFFRESRVENEIWFQQAKELKGMESWSFLYNDPDVIERYKGQQPAETPKVSLLREMSIPANHHVGMVQVDMLLKNFSPRTYSDTATQNNQSQMLIVDNLGQVFTRSENSFLAVDPNMSELIQNRLLHYKETGEWDIHYFANEKSYLLLHKPIERINANLINIVSMDGVLAEISNTRNLLIGANIAFITLMAIITYALNTFILKNLRLLTEEMKMVRKGKTFSGISIRGGGEIGELAHHFSKLMSTINTLVAQAVHKQAMTKEAELRTLHNQIDSHFLYNTLENIKMMAEIENQKPISDALTSLGGMMRYNIKWSGEYVKLSDEIRHIQNYTDVMNIRFDVPVELELKIPEQYLELEVLKMSLQPIVENVMKHAWGGEDLVSRTINIQVEEWQNDTVRMTTTDNGRGIKEEHLYKLNKRLDTAGMKHAKPYNHEDELERKGIGLLNVQERIRLFYGKEYGLKVYSDYGQFTRVEIILPKVLLTGRADNGNKVADR